MKSLSKHFWLLVGSLLLWGTSFPAMKLANNTNSPVAILFYRYLFSAVIVVVVFLIKYRADWSLLLRYRQLWLLGVLNFFGSLVQILGIARTTASKSVVLTQLLIVTVPFFAYFILKETLNRKQILAMVFSLTGAVMLSTHLNFQDIFSRTSILGDALVTLAVVFWALFIVYSRRYAQILKPFHLLFPSQMVTFLLALPLTAQTHRFAIDSAGLLLCLFLTLFCTVVPTLMFNYSLKEIDANTATILGPIELISGISIAFLFLGENLNAIEIVGMALILIAVFIMASKSYAKSSL